MLDPQKVRIYFAIVLLMLGVLYPEDKTKIAGIHWTPYIAAIGLLLITGFKRNLSDGIIVSISMVYLVLFVILTSLSFSLVGFNEIPKIEFLSKHYLTLLITTCCAFLLVSDLSVNLILSCIYRIMLTISLILIVVRLSIFDFSREGSFLGFGPLTFARYVCIGWIAQVVLDCKMRLMPSVIFVAALAISDSRGPILFLIFTLVLWALVNKKINWKGLVCILVSLFFILSLSGRFNALTDDLGLAMTDTYTVPKIEGFDKLKDGDITSFAARLIAAKSSVELIKERPIIGWGAGSWPRETGLYFLEYPHNSFLEVWFEYGVIGVIFLLFFVGRAAFYVLSSNPYSLFVIFCALLSTTTGSIKDLRVLFFFTLLAYDFMRNSRSQYFKIQ